MNGIVFFLLVVLFVPVFMTIFPANGFADGRNNMEKQNDTVILLHGLGRTKSSMSKLEQALSSTGYVVMNVQYPSTKYTIQELGAQYLAPAVKEAIKRNRPIHFVTHSMGGILVRHYLEKHPIPSLGRVVMLAPPNQGSEVADFLKNNVLFRLVMGPAGQQLGTSKDSLPQQLGSVCFDLGIIAGSRSYNPLFSLLLKGPDDGKVSVRNAAVEGMADLLVVPYSHTFIMMRSQVIGQVIHFLGNGSFVRS